MKGSLQKKEDQASSSEEKLKELESSIAEKEAENQRKALSDKILTLERQVKDARYREEEERQRRRRKA